MRVKNIEEWWDKSVIMNLVLNWLCICVYIKFEDERWFDRIYFLIRNILHF